MIQFGLVDSEDGSSSKSILRGGEYWSSICPCFTLQIKAPRKSTATLILAIRRMMITLIIFNGANLKRLVLPVSEDYQPMG
jgi:hypothetical protein